IGASSFSPSPITTTPSMETVSSSIRMASTAAPSAPSLSPRPIHLAQASAAYSVVRTSSIARLRSGPARLTPSGGAPTSAPASMAWTLLLSRTPLSCPAPGGFRRSTQQQLRHLLSWGPPSQGLPRPLVELGGDAVEFALVVHGQVGALGEVLAQQPVGVLVRAPLPG